MTLFFIYIFWFEGKKLANNEEFHKFIEELKSRTDIVQVIARYVPLERKGSAYWARCPFHGEKTPSFAVNEVDGYYHCFGCKAGGDVIKFIMEIESVPYMEAVNILAEKAGMTVPNFSGRNGTDEQIVQRKKYKDRLLALTKEAARYYHNNLVQGKAEAALKYLEKRNVPPHIVSKFGLGTSIDYNGVIEHLKELGYSVHEMLDAGVVKNNNRGYYDAVGGRLVFPLIDIMGNVVGFCGRLLENAKFAKYLNTAETILFSKGKTLYGINLIKKKKQEQPNSINYLIVVEGQMDVVSLHKAGFDTAVASMGTALTNEQARLIKRFSDNVLICYDGDFAGQKATIRGLEILKENGLNVKIMSLPEGLDPDDVINKMGKDAFLKLMKEALPLLDFKLERVKKQCNLETRDGRTKYINLALEVLKDVSSDVEREVYLSLVSETSRTNKDFLKRQLLGISASASEESKPLQQNSKSRVKVIDNAVIKAQKFILSCMLHLKPFAYFEKDIDYVFSGEDFVMLCKAIESGRGSVSTKQMIERCKEFLGEDYDEKLSEIINYLLYYGNVDNETKYFKDCLWIVYKNYLENRLEELNRRLLDESDNDLRKELIVEINDIVSKIKNKKVEL